MYPRRMKNKSERCVAGEKVTEATVISARETKHFFPATQPVDVCLSRVAQHSVIIFEVSLGNLPLVVPFLMGSVVNVSPHSEFISQPSDSILQPPKSPPPPPNLLASFNSHYSFCHHLLLHYPDCTKPSITH